MEMFKLHEGLINLVYYFIKSFTIHELGNWFHIVDAFNEINAKKLRLKIVWINNAEINEIFIFINVYYQRPNITNQWIHCLIRNERELIIRV